MYGSTTVDHIVDETDFREPTVHGSHEGGSGIQYIDYATVSAWLPVLDVPLESLQICINTVLLIIVRMRLNCINLWLII